MAAARRENLAAEVQKVAGYRGKPFPQTHPDRLATIAKLHGLEAASPERCRVLELGCGDGGNLVPMASELPASEFVGVDLDVERIAIGGQWCEELGLSNVTLEARDICAVGDRYGKFDYIIAHGVYSWVPGPVRRHLLELCRTLLKEHGVAFISFNVLPGWHFLEYMRDFIRLASEQPASAENLLPRVRGMARLFAEELAGQGPQQEHLKALFNRIAGSSDYLLAFDYLGEVSEPLSLGDFVTQAKAHELSFVADANFFETELQRVPARVCKALNVEVQDALLRERLADAFNARLFRRAIVCHEKRALRSPSADDARVFRILAEVKPLDDAKPGFASFEMLHQTKLSITSPIVKDALASIGAAWPRSLGFDELTEQVTKRQAATAPADVEKVLVSAIWELYGAGALDLRCREPRCVTEVTERPCTSRLARTRLRGGEETCTQHHDVARLTDAMSRALFDKLDGTLDRAQLAQALRAMVQAGALQISRQEEAQLDAEIEKRLRVWARLALLVDPATEPA